MFEDLKRRFRSFTSFISPRAQGLARRAVDVVSPNTPQDIARRQAAGQPASYQAQQAQLQAQRDAARARVQALKPTQRIISVTPQQRAFEENARIAQQGIAAGQRPSYGGGISGLFRRAQDVVSADTAQDIFKRQQAGQPRTYREQQVALGRTPDVNIGQALFREPATIANTLVARLREVPETARGVTAQLFGNQEALSASLKRQEQMRQSLYGKPESGILKTGTLYKTPEEAKSLSVAETTKRFVPNYLGTAAWFIGGGQLPKAASVGSKTKLAKFAAIEGLAAGLGAGAEEAARNKNATKESIIKQGGIGALFGFFGAPAVAFGTQKISSAILRNKAGREIVQQVAGEKDVNKLYNKLISANPELDEAVARRTAEELAQASTAKEVEQTLIRNADEANKLKLGQAAERGAQAQVPRIATTTAREATTPATEQLVSQAITTAVKPRTIQEARQAVETLFPTRTTAEKTQLISSIQNAVNDTDVQNILKNAQTRRTAVTEGVQQAVPSAPARQVEAIQQAAEAPAIAAPTPSQALPEAQIAEVPAAQQGILGRFRQLVADETGGARLRDEVPVSPEVEELRATRQRLQQQWDNATPQTRPSIENAIRQNDIELRRQQTIDQTARAQFRADEIGGARIEDIPFLRRFARGAEETIPPTQVAGAAQEGLQRTSGSLPPIIPEAGETLLEQSQRTGLTPSEILYGTRTPSPEQQLNFLQQKSPNRFIRENITRPLANAINAMFGSAQVSEVGVLRGVGRTGAGFGKEIGMTPELLKARRQLLQGQTELGKLTADDIVKIGEQLEDASKNRVWATLDPERAKELGINPTKVQLTPEELAYKGKIDELKNAFTEGNVSRGLISPEQANAEWFKRAYSIFDFASEKDNTYKEAINQMFSATKNKKQFLGRKKDITQDIVDSAIQDPSYLMAKKSAESHAAWAINDYANYLSRNGITSDVPRPGFMQLPNNKLYGEAAGKYVPQNVLEDFTGFQSNFAVMNSVNDFLNWYDRNPLRRGKKMILTVLNPAVRAGNRISNVIFAQLNGINPLTFTKNFAQVKALRESRDPIFIEAVRQGLVGNDLMRGDFAAKVASYTGEKNGVKKVLDWAKRSYSNADDDAKIAAFKSHVDRGYDFDTAAQLVQRGFQDSKSVGYFYDTAAKIPLVGNAFVRFAGDASRILVNSVIDNPLTVAGTIATVYGLGNALSRASGETAEEKKVRESRFGAPKLPFTNISLEFQTPIGAVNVARFLPFYELNDVGSPVTRFLPFSGNPLDPKNWSDPLLGQAAQLLKDKDFRGKSIKDPENTGQFLDRLSTRQENINRAKFAIPQNIPLGREALSIYQAAIGQPDIYGKERNLPQALARAGGIKIEQFGSKQVQEQLQQQRFQEDKKRIDEEATKLPKGAQEAYKQLTGYYKLREKVPNEFKPGTERYKKYPVYNFTEDKYKDIAKDPKVYDLLLQKKKQDNLRDGVPIAPEFDERLSLSFRRQLIANKALAPGDDAEADAKIRTLSEWDTYTNLKNQYTKNLEAKYGKREGRITDELVKNQDKEYPQKGAAKVAYDNAYKLYAQGLGPKPAFTDAVAADKDAYEENMRNWTNTARQARGLPPISKDVWDNVSFGFQSDEEKIYKELRYGRGFGRGFGFGGGGPQEQRQYLTQLLGQGVNIAQAPEIKATPTRFKVKVQKPSKGKKARIRLG